MRFLVDAEFIKANQLRENLVVEPFVGMAGCARAMRAIAPIMPPSTYPQQDHRRFTPRIFAAGAGGIKAVETCLSGGAKLRPTTRTRQRHIAGRVNLPLFR